MKKDAVKTYEYYRARLLKEAKRGGLTSQEKKLLKIVEEHPSNLNKAELSKKASKIKAEFKRVRKTKKYKEARKLRNTFYKELNKYRNEEIMREARARLMNLPPRPDQLQDAYFKVTSYQRLLKEGVTRRVNGKVVKYKGVEAVMLQIKSIKEANNPEVKKLRFIDTYIDQLYANGIPEEFEIEQYNQQTGEVEIITRYPIAEYRDFLMSLEPRQITFLLDTGQLHDIQFYYVITESDIEALIKRLDYLKRREWVNNYNMVNENINMIIKNIKKERKAQEKLKGAPTIHKN
ncbi:MAG: hypothetical protein LIR50_22140 [Bacillota bacterium]|nr:hypothetical protein [Bacillota bacterium]